MMMLIEVVQAWPFLDKIMLTDLGEGTLHQKQEIDQICKQNGWRSMQESHILGSEDQVVIIFDMGADPEHVSRAKNALILVTTQG